MFVRLTAFLAIAIAACSATAPGPQPPTPGDPAVTTQAPPSPLAGVMQQIAQHNTAIDTALVSTTTGDLREIANAATAAAELVRLGYGRLEDKQIPGFARHARDAESWFLQVALEARQAHGAIAREIFLAGRTTHCTSCHEACVRVPRERVRG